MSAWIIPATAVGGAVSSAKTARTSRFMTTLLNFQGVSTKGKRRKSILPTKHCFHVMDLLIRLLNVDTE
jgi:hypothetical protein